jgi:hypothetical protein
VLHRGCPGCSAARWAPPGAAQCALWATQVTTTLGQKRAGTSHHPQFSPGQIIRPPQLAQSGHGHGHGRLQQRQRVGQRHPATPPSYLAPCRSSSASSALQGAAAGGACQRPDACSADAALAGQLAPQHPDAAQPTACCHVSQQAIHAAEIPSPRPGPSLGSPHCHPGHPTGWGMRCRWPSTQQTLLPPRLCASSRRSEAGRSGGQMHHTSGLGRCFLQQHCRRELRLMQNKFWD